MPGQNLEIISVNIWSILISLCNLVIIYFIFKKFLFGRIEKFFDRRRSEIDKTYDEAGEAKKKAEQDKERYEAKLGDAEQEAAEIIDKARAKADGISSEIIRDANERAAEALRRSDENIALDKRRAANEIKDEISSLSVELAEKIVGREINEADHRALIDSFINDMNNGKGES
ncbi:MAG: F0F1 ATP synthase subunit B [Clostridia bacterium]|nr:F0F1 ATP synthase subunit B [Clostridia bacterium]